MSAPARLRELRMVGFKSFAEKTIVELGPGISAVVGPNGSGKSNLADALRWAMGEQGRSLRIRRAEDVIFAGSERRHAIGMADVTLVLDNADGLLPLDYAEVSVGRRLFRSGENDYLVNRQRVRLRDLVDLLDAASLADNAFLFIGQGMVDQALALRPEERRPLFEEVAGVRRHDRRRRQAEAQLAEAEVNLARVRDVLDELRPQARRLSLQVEQEQARGAAAEELATALILAAWTRWRAAAVARSSGASALAAARGEASAALRELRAAEEQIGALGRSLAARTEDERATREALDAVRAESTALQLTAGRLESTLAALDRDRARLSEEQASVQERLVAARRVAAVPIPEAAGETAALLSDLERELGAATAEAARLEAVAGDATERDAALRRAATARAADLESALRREAEASARSAAQSLRRAVAASASREAEAAWERATADLAAALAREQAADAELEVARTALDAAGGLQRERAARVVAAESGLAAARSQLAALDARIVAEEGTGITAAARRHGGRRVADGLDVEPSLRTAVEAALGAALRAAALPADGVASLRGERGWLVLAGVPAPRTPEREAARAREAAISAGGGVLAEAVRHDPGGVASRLLASSLWVPAFGDALVLVPSLPAGWRVATPAGEVITASGVVSFAGGPSLLDLRAEREALDARTQRERESVSAAAALAAEAAAAFDAERERAAACRVALELARREHRKAEEAERAAARTGEQAARELAWEAAQADRLAADADRAAEAARALEPAVASRAASRRDDDSPGVGAAATWQARVVELLARRDQLAARVDAVALERRRAEDARSRAEATIALDEATLRRIASALPELAAEREAAATEHARVQGALAGVRDRERAHTGELDRLLAAADTERQALAAGERSAASARDALRAAEERSRAAEVVEVEARLAQETVREQLLVELAAAGRAGLDALRGAAGAAPTGTAGAEAGAAGAGEEDLASALESALAGAAERWSSEDPPADPPGAARLATLRRRFHELGATNPFAAREYDELRARLDELERQRTDLGHAIDTTRSLIAELSALIAGQFRDTFRALEGAFERRFARLFGGGVARLSLTEPEDLEATGVEIVAQPPGKKRQPLAMLSGGERALTAVALLFAMLEVRPVPFCVLDEVDAALDEANIGRFAESLRELAETTQCIVITHNRGTIEAADALYGVTIGDDAVSRVISLRLDDAQVAADARTPGDVSPIDARG